MKILFEKFLPRVFRFSQQPTQVSGDGDAVAIGVPTALTPNPSFRTALVSVLAAAIGLLAGIVAFILYNLIALCTNLVFFHRFSWVFTSARSNHLGPVVIVVPVIGGIIVGFMAKYGSSKIRGHGIPEAMEAVLVSRSRIEPKVAILKPISAAIAIGTGGPFGAEGPIIQTGGAIGSLIGQLIHTTAAERKVLLACGAAAGMSATFNTPLAGVIVAIELLLFEFKSRSFIPLVIASTLATTVHEQLMGRGPMFSIGPTEFALPRALPFYLVLGVLCGLTAVAFSKALYWVEDKFEELPVDPMWWPAIGALGLGIIGYFVPRVLGVGYDTISDILNNRLTLELLIIVMVFKAIALMISLGSGTSGGLLAPMFMSSAALGAAFAILINHIFPSAGLAPGAFALVAMGAVFGAASRATFAFIVFAFELTRNYDAVLPLMLVCVIADGIAVMLMPTSIMTEKLARRGLKIDTEFEPDVLRQVSVNETMSRDFAVVSGDVTVSELADRIGRNEREVTQHAGVFVTDGGQRIAGIVTRSDLLRALEERPNARVVDVASRNLVVTYPDESLYDAAAKMLRADVGRLPVISRENPGQPVGYLGRSGILAARLRRLDEEHKLETGWIRRRRV